MIHINAFLPKFIEHTVEKHGIPKAEIPAVLWPNKPLPKRTNGSGSPFLALQTQREAKAARKAGKAVLSIPLSAVPERPEKRVYTTKPKPVAGRTSEEELKAVIKDLMLIINRLI